MRVCGETIKFNMLDLKWMIFLIYDVNVFHMT